MERCIDAVVLNGLVASVVEFKVGEAVRFLQIITKETKTWICQQARLHQVERWQDVTFPRQR